MALPSSCTEPARFPSVLVMSSTFPRWQGDATPRFVRDLAELATREWNVTVLAPHHPGAALHDRSRGTHGSIEVHRFRYWLPSSRQRLCYGGGILPNVRASTLALAQVPFLFGAELTAMRRLLAKDAFDLVHAHFLVPQGAVAAMASRRPLIVSIHGSDLFALRGRVIDAAIRGVIDRAKLVTVNGEAAAREARRRFPQVERKLRILPMGVDSTLFRPPHEDERRAPASDPVVAFVGRLTEQKGAHVLLDAFARLGRRARLVVAGEGPELERLRARASGRVDFVGPLSPVRVAQLLREATLLVVPSLEGSIGVEAQGLVAIEAMASACPVIVSRSGGLAELVGDSERGIAVTPSDSAALATAIADCLDDVTGTRARSEKAHAFAVARYSWTRIGQELLALYEEARRC